MVVSYKHSRIARFRLYWLLPMTQTPFATVTNGVVCSIVNHIERPYCNVSVFSIFKIIHHDEAANYITRSCIQTSTLRDSPSTKAWVRRRLLVATLFRPRRTFLLPIKMPLHFGMIWSRTRQRGKGTQSPLTRIKE